MPYRDRFDCLWCGTAWTTRGHADLEGWAQLCPACLGRAGANTFLRARLRAALAERAEHAGPAGTRAPDPRAHGLPDARDPSAGPPRDPMDAGSSRPTTRAAARPPSGSGGSPLVLHDDWFLRRDPYARGAVHDAAWAAELDMVTRWLDGRRLSGRILEPSAGVGFFSPLLAARGELHATDPVGPALDRARQRLLAHRLRAHLHVADPWAPPAPGDRPADALVAAFLVGRVRGVGLDAALASFRTRLRPGGQLALVDLRPDPAGGPPAGETWSYHDPALLETGLHRAGFGSVSVTETGRFFLVASAVAV